MEIEAGLIGSAEAAALLKKDRSAVSRLVGAGKLTPVKKMPGPRGAYVFKRADIEALAGKESAA